MLGNLFLAPFWWSVNRNQADTRNMKKTRLNRGVYYDFFNGVIFGNGVCSDGILLGALLRESG